MLNSRQTLRFLQAAGVAAALAGAAASSQAAEKVAGVSVHTHAVSSAVYRSGGPVGVVNVGYRGGYGHGGYYRGGGYCCGWGLGVGLGLGVLLASPWYYPGYVVTQPTTVIVESQPQQQPQPNMAPLPPQASRPDPVIYPRNGQSPQQLETDRQECNRWASTQAGALTDSSVFMRAVDACMDGRGYTTK